MTNKSKATLPHKEATSVVGLSFIWELEDAYNQEEVPEEIEWEEKRFVGMYEILKRGPGGEILSMTRKVLKPVPELPREEGVDYDEPPWLVE